MRLAIYRGDTLDRHVELSDADLRIGRAHENDLVLEDASKGVSRFHAEIRREHDRFVVVDLNSQNGVWIQDRRVTRGPLEPGTPITVGPYRLVLEGTEDSQLPTDTQDMAQPPAQAGGASPGLPAQTDSAKPARGGLSVPAVNLKLVAAIAGGCVVLAVLIAAAIWLTRSEPAPVESKTAEPAPVVPPPAETGADHVRKARELLTSGDVAAARGELNAALALEAASEEAIQLQTDVAFEEHLQKGEGLLSAGDAPGAMAEVDQALTLKPSDERAADLKSRATVRPPVLVPGPSPASTEKLDPVGARPGETDKVRKERQRAASDAYGKAKAALARGDFVAAIQMMEELNAREPNYSDLPGRLEQARVDQKNASRLVAQNHFRDAGRLEAKGDWSSALAEYRAAAQADPTMSEATSQSERLRKQIDVQVDQALKDAAFREKFPDPDNDRLRRSYETVVKLLPDGDPRKKAAQDKLAELGR